MSPEERTLDSNEGPIGNVVMAAEAKRKRVEEEEKVPLLRKKRRVSPKIAEDEEPKNTDQRDRPESPVAATSFDQLAEKERTKRAKWRKELRALRKGVETIAKDALVRTKARKEVRPQEGGETQVLPDPRIEAAALAFVEEMEEEERIEKAATELERELQIEEDAELAARLNAQEEGEGKKKKKKKSRKDASGRMRGKNKV